jgi:hypothetical protein
MSKNIDTFSSKLTYICEKVVSINGSLVICDFMFSLNQDNAYKTAIRNIAKQYPQFVYLDFAELWFSNITINKFSELLSSDGVHPTPKGHKFIAETIMKTIGIPYQKDDITPIVENIPLNSGWQPALTNSDKYESGLFVHKYGNIVYVHGNVCKSSSIAQFETIGNLSYQYTPVLNKIFSCSANHGFGEIEIDSNGKILYLAGDCDSIDKYLSINAVYMLE